MSFIKYELSEVKAIYVVINSSFILWKPLFATLIKVWIEETDTKDISRIDYVYIEHWQ